MHACLAHTVKLYTVVNVKLVYAPTGDLEIFTFKFQRQRVAECALPEGARRIECFYDQYRPEGLDRMDNPKTRIGR